MSITHAGDSAVDLFCQQTGAERLKHSSKIGDAMILGQPFEVKRTVKGTLNQVRPSRYCVLAVIRDDKWYVIPANAVVRAAATRKGQHTPNPFICVNLDLDMFKEYEVRDNLFDTCVAAIMVGMSSPLKVVMAGIQAEVELQAEQHRKRVLDWETR